MGIEGDSMICTNSQQSAYLTRVVSDGISTWRFRIDKYSGGYQVLGVWKTQHDPVLDSWYESHTNKSYSFVLDQGKLMNPANTSLLGSYGVKIKNGDIVEMT